MAMALASLIGSSGMLNLEKLYSGKWRSHDLQARANWLDCMIVTEDSDDIISWQLITQALDMVSKSCGRDANGVEVLIFCTFVYGCPGAAEGLFTELFVKVP